MSLWSVAFMGSTPIGGPIVGWIGGSAGPRWALGVGGAAAIAAAALGWRTLRSSHLAPASADVAVADVAAPLEAKARHESLVSADVLDQVCQAVRHGEAVAEPHIGLRHLPQRLLRLVQVLAGDLYGGQAHQGNAGFGLKGKRSPKLRFGAIRLVG